MYDDVISLIQMILFSSKCCIAKSHFLMKFLFIEQSCSSMSL